MKTLAWLSLLLILGPGADPAWAHEWFTGKQNPKTLWSCCYGGPSGDCQPVDEADWWREGAEYKVRKDGVIYSIPADQAQASLDPQGRAAACIMAGVLRCFFVPLNG